MNSFEAEEFRETKYIMHMSENFQSMIHRYPWKYAMKQIQFFMENFL